MEKQLPFLSWNNLNISSYLGSYFAGFQRQSVRTQRSWGSMFYFIQHLTRVWISADGFLLVTRTDLVFLKWVGNTRLTSAQMSVDQCLRQHHLAAPHHTSPASVTCWTCSTCIVTVRIAISLEKEESSDLSLLWLDSTVSNTTEVRSKKMSASETDTWKIQTEPEALFSCWGWVLSAFVTKKKKRTNWRKSSSVCQPQPGSYVGFDFVSICNKNKARLRTK